LKQPPVNQHSNFPGASIEPPAPDTHYPIREPLVPPDTVHTPNPSEFQTPPPSQYNNDDMIPI